MTNSIKFTPTAKPVKAEPDSVVTIQNLPADNPGIRIGAGSSGYIKFGGKATANSFDVDARNASKTVYKLPKGTTHFSVAGGPLYYTIGTAEWVS